MSSWPPWVPDQQLLLGAGHQGKNGDSFEGSWRSPDYRGQRGQRLWEEVGKHQGPLKLWLLEMEAKCGHREPQEVAEGSSVSVLHADTAVIFLKYPPDFHASARKSKTLFGDPQLGIVGLFWTGVYPLFWPCFLLILGVHTSLEPPEPTQLPQVHPAAAYLRVVPSAWISILLDFSSR